MNLHVVKHMLNIEHLMYHTFCHVPLQGGGWTVIFDIGRLDQGLDMIDHMQNKVIIGI